MGIIIGVLSGMLWGLNDVFANIYSQQALVNNTTLAVIILALFLSLMQDAFSCASIFGYHHFKGTFKKNLKQNKKSFLLLCVAAICAGPLGMVAGIVGIAYAGPVYAGVITSCYPVVALLLAIVFLRERPTRLKIMGIILSVISVIFISIAGERSGITNISIGLLFAVCAMIGWGMESILFSVAAKKTDQDTSWLLAVRQFCSAISYVVILSVLFYVKKGQFIAMLQGVFLPLLILGCVVTAATSYLAYYHAIKRIGPSLGTTFNASFIFWAGIFSVLFHIASLHASFIAWGSVLILGIYFASSGTFKAQKMLV
ncbi:DMT family transporter [Facilibium subflavum]|uniref:DMT family transporter n=1 Tax=Facilibium subflavum TaxID=2219058 RepID=UPI000E64CB22|nr:DMT family transporter [Facilibium subflavum]